MRGTRRAAGIAAALVGMAALVAGCGDLVEGGATTTIASVTPTSVAEAPGTTEATPPNPADPSGFEAMLARLDADPSTAPPLQASMALGGPADDDAAAGIIADVETATGASVSGLFDLWVFPVIGSSDVLLILEVHEGAEDDSLPDDFIEALVASPSAEAAGVTMFVLLIAGSDELGDFVMTSAVRWVDARAAIIDGVDITDRISVQLTRDGRVVDR
jgi:hypothetical protein